MNVRVIGCLPDPSFGQRRPNSAREKTPDTKKVVLCDRADEDGVVDIEAANHNVVCVVRDIGRQEALAIVHR